MGRREEKAETNYRIKANLKTSHELLLLNIGSTFQEFNSCKESLPLRSFIQDYCRQ